MEDERRGTKKCSSKPVDFDFRFQAERVRVIATDHREAGGATHIDLQPYFSTLVQVFPRGGLGRGQEVPGTPRSALYASTHGEGVPNEKTEGPGSLESFLWESLINTNWECAANDEIKGMGSLWRHLEGF